MPDFITAITDLLRFLFSSFSVWLGFLVYLLVITRDANKLISFVAKKTSSLFSTIMSNYRKKLSGVENAGKELKFTNPNRSYVPKAENKGNN